MCISPLSVAREAFTSRFRASARAKRKVQITINNAVREYDAVTDGETIPTGKAIKVTEVINDYTLLVEELTPTII